MIEFSDGRIPERNLRTLTAYVNEFEFMQHGRELVRTVIYELVKQSVLLHRIDLENAVTEIVSSLETRKYIETGIREAIDKAIQEEVNNIFSREL